MELSATSLNGALLRRDLLQKRSQLVEFYGFGQMIIEASFHAPSDIFPPFQSHSTMFQSF
jgi:hypothetical protein